SEMGILRMILAFLRAFLATRADLAAENAILRHPLIVLQRSIKRPRLGKSDRVLFVWLSRLWSGQQSALLIIQPATIIRWHLSLDRNSPDPRTVQPPEKGEVVAKAYLGGLHHGYTRAA
ncbi:MAG: hypothetical protein WCK05_04035, partial [Planctomycetota bacterium]